MCYIIITQKYFDIYNQYYLHCNNTLEMIKTPHKLIALSESQMEQNWLNHI